MPLSDAAPGAGVVDAPVGLLFTEGAVFVTINRPARKNAFDAETIAALREAFETLHGADHVRVVFVRGAGGTFSAGADLGWNYADAPDLVEAALKTRVDFTTRKALHPLLKADIEAEAIRVF